MSADGPRVYHIEKRGMSTVEEVQSLQCIILKSVACALLRRSNHDWMSLFYLLNSDRKYHPLLLVVKVSYTGSLRSRGTGSARAWRRAMLQNLRY
jgi:hypothetical protein